MHLLIKNFTLYCSGKLEYTCNHTKNRNILDQGLNIKKAKLKRIIEFWLDPTVSVWQIYFQFVPIRLTHWTEAMEKQWCQWKSNTLRVF